MGVREFGGMRTNRCFTVEPYITSVKAMIENVERKC